MRTLRGMLDCGHLLDCGHPNLKQPFRSSEAGISHRWARGIIGSIALVLSLVGANVYAQAQNRHVSSSDTVTTGAPTVTRKSKALASEPMAAAPVIHGAQHTFTPQALFVPQVPQQVPLSAGQSLLNQQFRSQPGMTFAPTTYGAMPYSPSQVYPAAFHGPPQPAPDLMPDPMMPDPMMPGSTMPGSTMPGPMMSSGEPMPGYDYGMGMGGGEMCPQCGGAGCGNCSGHGDGVLGGFLSRLGPYSEGGRCAPRWYDIAVDGLYWTRDEVSDFVPFTAFTRFGEIILSSDDLEYDEQPGMRFSSTLQMMPGVSLDFTYFGMFSWSANASVSSPVGNELFSPFSDFGALIGVGQPFDESDQAQFNALRASTTIDNFELNVRKYWTGPNCRLQGSIKTGARYIYLVDDLNFFTLGRNVPVGLGTAPAGTSSTDVRAHNSLIGFQSGFDLWATIVPGILVGTDMKAGVYGNHGKQNTRVFGSTTAGGTSAELFESSTNNDVAVVGEANLTFIYKVNPNCTLRCGYSALYIDGIALAPENFNTDNPFNNTRTVAELDDNGNVFYHGGFAGFEWMW